MLKKLDPFLLSLLTAVGLATVLPCPDRFQPWLERLTSLLIMMMFFLQGLKLQRSALWASLKNWQLQGAVLLTTYALFPLFGLGLATIGQRFFPHLLTPTLWKGVLFLCCLPSTVQSSIAITSIARGNVPAAICAATASNIIGIFLTPLLVGLTLGPAVAAHGGGSGSSGGIVLAVMRELLLPFIAGQCLQRWLGAPLTRHKFLLSLTDRGSIVVIVYAAFSAAVQEGLWHRVPARDFLDVTLVCLVVLGVLLVLTKLTGRWIAARTLARTPNATAQERHALMQQLRSDTIALQFCGSKKALSTGMAMASVLFPSGAGIIVVPLMIYHQLQLFLCTLLARHYARTDHGTGTEIESESTPGALSSQRAPMS